MFFEFLKEQPPTPMGNIVSSCVFDLDATLSASYIGTGANLENAEQSPADGELQSEYDFGTGAGAPTFIGTHGSKNAYFSFNADSFEADNALSAFLDSLHKTTGGTDFGFVMTVYVKDGNQVFCGNKEAGGANIGVYMYTLAATDDLYLGQRGDSAAVTVQSTIPLTLNAWNFIAVSHSHSTNITKLWVNTTVGQAISHTFDTTTTTASAANFMIGSYGDGTLPLATDSMMRGFQCFNSYLTDANISSIVTELNRRHGTSYLFKPTDTATLAYWLEDPINNATYDSAGLISSWDDLSGNGKLTVQATDDDKLTVYADQLNGFSVARGLGSKLMTSDYQLASGGYTIFVAFRLNQAITESSSFKKLIKSDGDSQSLFLRLSSTNFEIKSLNTGTNDPRPTFDFDSVYATGETAILTCVVQLDSLQTDANSVEKFDTARSGTASSLTVDTSTNIFEDVAGDLACILGFSSVLSDADILANQNYLAKFIWQGVLALSEDAGLAQTPVEGNQGIAADSTHFYSISNTTCHKYDSGWNIVASVTNLASAAGLPATIDHAGDATVYDGKIYIPMEDYPNSPYDTQYIAVFNTSDLSFVEYFDISAQATEISGLGYNPGDGLLYASSFVTDGVILRYTLAGVYVDSITLSTEIASTQGVCFWKGYMWLSSSSPTQDIYQYQENGSYIGRAFNFASSTESEGLAPFGEYLITTQITAGSTKNVQFLELS
jgi:hypothetical protein